MTEYGQRQRFFEALARSVLAAPQPLVLLVDDLQWCDRESIEWLHYLLRFDPHARMLVVGTARDEEIPGQHPLRGLLLHLRAGRIPVAEIALEPLDAAETASLAGHVARRELDELAALRLFRETEGNPLFVVEMARAGLGAATAVAQDRSGSDPSRSRWRFPRRCRRSSSRAWPSSPSRRGSWHGSPPPSAAASASTCSSRPVSSPRTGWPARWTSCGTGASSGRSARTATTSPTTSCAR